MQTLHSTNILLHILAGTGALTIGFIAAIAPKDHTHKRIGTIFCYLMALVILTALIGVFVFNGHHFLLVITMLSGYNCFSGIRTMQLKGNKPKTIDYLIPMLTITTAIYFLTKFSHYWSPAVTYATLSTLFLITLYDLCKPFYPGTFLKRAIFYEHAYKMFSALSALASAFCGTVLPQFKPYSQLAPSVILTCWLFVIFINKHHATSRA